MNLLFYFFITAGGLLYFAKRLTHSGECLGERLGLDSTLIGAILLASITSLPELVTSGASAYIGNESMAVANIFGSNIFNLSIIFFIDIFLLRGCHIIGRVEKSGSLKMLKGLIAGILLFIAGFWINIELGRVSLITPLIFILCMKFFQGEEGEAEECSNTSLKKQVLLFLGDSLGVIILSIVLSRIANLLSITPVFGITLGQTVVGGGLLALITSLPEFAVSIEAIKRKNYNMAMGNILGSNLFNLASFILLDLVTSKSIYLNLGQLNHYIIAGALIMHIILFLGISLRNRYFSMIMGITYFYFTYLSLG